MIQKILKIIFLESKMNGENGNEPNDQERPNGQDDQGQPNEQPNDQNNPNHGIQNDQNNNEAERRNRHAQGAIGLEGFAQEWFRNRRLGLARLENRPRERQAYNLAMDRLFLNSERVSYSKCRPTVITEIV